MIKTAGFFFHSNLLTGAFFFFFFSKAFNFISLSWVWKRYCRRVLEMWKGQRQNFTHTLPETWEGMNDNKIVELEGNRDWGREMKVFSVLRSLSSAPQLPTNRYSRLWEIKGFSSYKTSLGKRVYTIDNALVLYVGLPSFNSWHHIFDSEAQPSVIHEHCQVWHHTQKNKTKIKTTTKTKKKTIPFFHSSHSHLNGNYHVLLLFLFSRYSKIL